MVTGYRFNLGFQYIMNVMCIICKFYRWHKHNFSQKYFWNSLDSICFLLSASNSMSSCLGNQPNSDHTTSVHQKWDIRQQKNRYNSNFVSCLTQSLCATRQLRRKMRGWWSYSQYTCKARENKKYIFHKVLRCPNPVWQVNLLISELACLVFPHFLDAHSAVR